MTATRIDPDELLPSNPEGKAASVPEFHDVVIAAINEHADEIDARIKNATDYGATGGGVVDDTEALQRAIDAADSTHGGGVGIRGSTVIVPAGTYLVSSPLDVPNNVSIVLDPGATIKATASMIAMLRQADNTQLMRENLISGGAWDANGLATDAIWIRYAGGVRIQNTSLMNIKGTGIHFGDTGAPDTSFGLYTDDVSVWRLSGSNVTGSIGIYLETGCGDCLLRTSQLVGVETGIKISSGSGNNRVIGAHAWSPASAGSTKVAFEDNGNGNTWIGAYADTPSENGFKIGGQNTVLVGCKVFNNNIYGTDNVVVGVTFTVGSPTVQFATIVGMHFKGTDASHRLAKDVDIWDTSGLQMLGSQLTNVVSSVGATNVQAAAIAASGTITSAGRLVLNAAIGATNRRIDVKTGSSLRWSFGGDDASESGANAGTGFILNSYDDNGAIIGTQAFCRRSDGQWTLAGPVVLGGGVFIGAGGTKLTQTKVYTPSLTPVAVAANTSAEQMFAVTGLTTADTVIINPPSGMPSGLGIVGVRVSATDTLAVRFANNTAGSLTPVSGVYRVMAVRS